MKKKLFSLALALALCLGLAVPAFAEEPAGITVIIPFGKYDDIDFSDGMAIVSKDTGKTDEDGDAVYLYGLVDKAGEIIPCEYDRFNSFSEGLAAAEKDGKCGFIDTSGEVAIPFEYDDVGDFSEGLAMVGKGDAEGFIDTTGKVVIPIEKHDYSYSGNFHDGLAMIGQDGKWGFIDKTGKVVVPCQYDDAGTFSEGMAMVKKDGKYGFIDKTGKEVVSCRYDPWPGNFSEGMAVVLDGDKYGFVDKTGKEVIPCQYDAIGGFSEGLSMAAKDGKAGFIDATGKEVIPFQFDSAGDFSEGLAAVEKGGKEGFIDKEGKEVISCQYDFVGIFSEGLALIATEDADGNWKYGYVDKTGKEVIPCQYDRAWSYDDGAAVVEKDGKWGAITYEAAVPDVSFTDVVDGAYYADPVKWAVRQNITTGTGAGKFSPDQTCTQTQILTFLYRAEQKITTPSAADMDAAVAWAKEKGMIDGSFNGSTPCTRATAVKYMWQAAGKPSAKPSSFTDVPADADYAQAVSWAVENDVTKGKGSTTTFAPDDTCTRGEIVTFLYRYYGK